MGRGLPPAACGAPRRTAPTWRSTWPSGDYLADGAVLFDDGEMVLAIARRSEPALLVRLDAGLSPERLLEQAIRLGHAFGNQHVPVDVEDGVVRVPLTTSEAIARATVEALGLDGAAWRWPTSLWGGWRRCPWGTPTGTGTRDERPGCAAGDASAGGRRAADRPLRAFQRLGGVAARARRRRARRACRARAGGGLPVGRAARRSRAGPRAARELDRRADPGWTTASARASSRPPARHASQTCGRQLAALAPQLAPYGALVAELAERVRAGETDGNLAVVQGALARALGISALDAVLVELRSAAAGLLSAAVRLGALSPVRAQVILAELAPALATAAESAVELRARRAERHGAGTGAGRAGPLARRRAHVRDLTQADCLSGRRT